MCEASCSIVSKDLVTDGVLLQARSYTPTEIDFECSQPSEQVVRRCSSYVLSSGISAKDFQNSHASRPSAVVRTGNPRNSGPCADDSGIPPKVRRAS